MTICVIPARFQSVRFPGKLLKKADGKTVLQRTFESALSCPDLDALYVATDDERIAEHIRELNGEVIWTSPDCRNGTERIIEALKNNASLRQADLIVNLQGDHPLTSPKTISKIIESLKEDKTAVLSTAATRLKKEADYLSPHTVKCVFDRKGNALYFSRSPIPHHLLGAPLEAFGHIGIYCYRKGFLLHSSEDLLPTPLSAQEDLEQLRVLENGHKIKIVEVEEELLGIDTPYDLVKLEEILCLRNMYL